VAIREKRLEARTKVGSSNIIKGGRRKYFEYGKFMYMIYAVGDGHKDVERKQFKGAFRKSRCRYVPFLVNTAAVGLEKMKTALAILSEL